MSIIKLKTKNRTQMFLWVVFFILLLCPINYSLSGDNQNEFLAKVDTQNVKILQDRGYTVEKLALRSSPDLYTIKRGPVGLFATLVEPLYIKDKREKKQYKITTNDASYGSQWNIPKIKADEAWGAGAVGSDTVTVAVLDTGLNIGMDASHPIHEEFIGRIWQNTGETNCGDGVDNNAPVNGFADDCYGWNFVENKTDPSPVDGGSTDNDYRHGTLVSGVIAATANNTVGITGVDQHVKIMPIRAMDNYGNGYTDDIALGIQYATDNGAKVINMSLGYEHSLGSDPTLEAAINDAYARGVVIVAAAGNDDQGVNWPAASPNVIAVGATDQSDNKAGFSSHGSELDVMAPGVSIPTTSISWTGTAYTTDSYASASGTSLSSPHLAGHATLLFAQFPTATNKEIMDMVVASADKIPQIADGNFSEQYGFGRANVRNSLNFNNQKNPNGTLIKSPDSPNVYVVEGGQKQWIGDPQFFRTRYHWELLLTISRGRIERYPTVSDLHFPDGTLIKGTSHQVYILEGGKKRWINDPAVFVSLGYNWDNIVYTSDAEINYYDTAANLSTTTNHPNGTLIKSPDSPNVYLLETGTKRYIGNPNVLTSRFFWRNLVNISTAEMSGYPSGSDMHYPDGTLLKGSSRQVYVVENGEKRWITSPEIFRYLNYDWNDVIYENDAEVNYYTSGTSL